MISDCQLLSYISIITAMSIKKTLQGIFWILVYILLTLAPVLDPIAWLPAPRQGILAGLFGCDRVLCHRNVDASIRSDCPF